jgi:lysophospholipid acyltransferase 1/2
MPGVHTFYDGSKVLEPFADIVGVDVDKVNLVCCQFFSIAFALIYYKLLSPEKVSKTTRLTFPLIIGLSLCYFCYGNAIKHLFGVIGVCYALLQFAPIQHVHKVVFIFSMGYLIFIHWYRWYVLTNYYIDVTGPMMVLVQKTTTFAFSLHDGRVKKPSELNEIQKREALKEVPSILDYLSYCFHFQTVLTGPLCFYTDFQRFISGENLIVKDKHITPWKPAIAKLSFAFCCLALILCVGKYTDPGIIATKEYQSSGLLQWSMLFFFVIFVQRVHYYYAWVLADGICNLSGFGFNGFDSNGKQKWDLVSNVDPYKVEMALSFKETLDAWNMTTMYWLRRVAFDRVPKNMRTVSTYLLSALWHGFFFGYYLTFLTGALVTVSARIIRRCLRFRFQGSQASARFYDVLTFFATKFALAYTTFPFVTLHLYPGLQVYKETYFILHILCFLGIFVLPKVFPPEKKPKKDEENISRPPTVYEKFSGRPIAGYIPEDQKFKGTPGNMY